MKLLDIYVAKHVLGGFLVVLLVVAGLDMLFALVEELKDVGGIILLPRQLSLSC